jgi:hypothetical protein
MTLRASQAQAFVEALKPRRPAPRLPLNPSLKPMQQLGRTLSEIADRYGVSRREWVMLEMEYAAREAEGLFPPAQSGVHARTAVNP